MTLPVIFDRIIKPYILNRSAIAAGCSGLSL